MTEALQKLHDEWVKLTSAEEFSKSSGIQVVVVPLAPGDVFRIVAGRSLWIENESWITGEEPWLPGCVRSQDAHIVLSTVTGERISGITVVLELLVRGLGAAESKEGFRVAVLDHIRPIAVGSILVISQSLGTVESESVPLRAFPEATAVRFVCVQAIKTRAVLRGQWRLQCGSVGAVYVKRKVAS